MATTITCSRCGATMTGPVSEALAWDKSHDEFCPALHREVLGGDRG